MSRCDATNSTGVTDRSTPGGPAPAWVLDLDGVMWLGDHPIPGSVDAVQQLRSAGRDVVFCTNHAEPAADKASVLDSIGVPEAEVVTALDAVIAATLPDERVAVLGSASSYRHVASLRDAVDLRAGSPWTLPDGIDVVIVGAHGEWDRERIGAAATLVRNGARFLATNSDATFPTSTPSGVAWILPGNGALVSAVETASGVEATVTGKPNEPMAAAIRSGWPNVECVVGDRSDTDGGLAGRLGVPFGLVLSGATVSAELSEVRAALGVDVIIGNDLADVVARRLATSGER